MKKKLNISGMHCVSCEILIKRHLDKYPQIKDSSVSHKNACAEIEYEGAFPEEEIKEFLENLGYSLKKEESTVKKKFTLKDLGQIFIAIFLVLIAYYFLSKLEILSFLPSLNSSFGVLVALFLGIVASLSTCLALTGGIVIGFSSLYKVKEKSVFYRIVPQLYFHLGRIISFFFLGGLLGVLGSKINYSFGFTALFSVFIALLMFYIALNLLGLLPSISTLGIHLPKSFSEKIHNFSKKEHGLVPFLIGVLTFFLPCGFTQSVQLAAIASANFWTAAAMMAFFALGTMPVLLIVGVSSSYINSNRWGFLKKLVAVLIIFFSLYNINTALFLSGSSITIDFWNSGEKKESIIENNEQIAEIEINYAIKTKEIKVKAGEAVLLRINAVNLTACVDEIIIPKLDFTSGKLNKGINEFEITFPKAGVYPFSCWMGMQGGKFIVE